MKGLVKKQAREKRERRKLPEARLPEREGEAGLPERKNGFTLIELLVVISIIALLASVVLASLNSARDKAENSATIQAVKQYQTALELYRNDHGKYPGSTNYSCLGNPPEGQSKCTLGHNSGVALVELEPYMSSLKNSNQKSLQITTTSSSWGSMYKCISVSCSEYQLYFFLKGNVGCILPNISTRLYTSGDSDYPSIVRNFAPIVAGPPLERVKSRKYQQSAAFLPPIRRVKAHRGRGGSGFQ